MLTVGDAPPGSVILVCDDERHIVRLIQVNLERQGYTVLCAFDGNEALEILRSKPVDVLIIDGKMVAPSTDEIIAQMRDLPDAESIRLIVLDKKH